ncbi:DUF5684 domain-containing protein [Geomonas limicola]|nr:DUF5684 domain-containing protein [Geomonas limicola]
MIGGAESLVILVSLVAFWLYPAICFYLLARKTKTEPAWLAWIPIANLYVCCKMARMSGWWFLLCLIPYVGVIFILIIFYRIPLSLGISNSSRILSVLPFINYIYFGYLAFRQEPDGVNQAACSEGMSLPKEEDSLTVFFRIMFIYLGASAIISWAVSSALMYSRLSPYSLTFNKADFLLRTSLGLASSLFYAWVLWKAREGRSVKLLVIALGYAVLGACTMLMFRFVLKRPAAGESDQFYTFISWLSAVVAGRGYPVGWIVALIAMVSKPSQSFYAILNIFQSLFALSLFSFALAKQPEKNPGKFRREDGSKPEGVTTHQAKVQPGSENCSPDLPELSSTSSCYIAATTDGSIRQVVVSLPPASAVETEFSTIILPADKFPILAMHSWCSGFCKINGQHVMMLRVGDFAAAVKNAGITVGLSFCHMPTHPVFLVSVRIDSPDLTGAVRSKFPHVPALSKPIAEWVSGLNPYDRELIPSVLSANPFRVILAEDSPSKSVVYLPDGQTQESAMPDAVCEFSLVLEDGVIECLKQQWEELLRHDASIPGDKRDFNMAANFDLVRLMPLDRDPIMPKKQVT